MRRLAGTWLAGKWGSGRYEPWLRLTLWGLVALAVIAYGAFVGLRPGRMLMREPATLPGLGAELFELNAAAITRRGPAVAVVLRIYEPVALVPYHYQTAGLRAPASVEAWADYLRAPVVFNAGQFDTAQQHLGWLKGEGKWLSSRLKPGWKGLLLTQPTLMATPRASANRRPWGQIIDLEERFDVGPQAYAERYDNVVQSMMLVDQSGKVRVRDTEREASRTVVAQDRQGRLLVLLTLGAVTLADLARWLPHTSLQIVRAMNLDGGLESQLVVRAGSMMFTRYGQYGTGSSVFRAPPGSTMAQVLPAVVALRPYKHRSARPGPILPATKRPPMPTSGDERAFLQPQRLGLPEGAGH